MAVNRESTKRVAEGNSHLPAHNSSSVALAKTRDKRTRSEIDNRTRALFERLSVSYEDPQVVKNAWSIISRWANEANQSKSSRRIDLVDRAFGIAQQYADYCPGEILDPVKTEVISLALSYSSEPKHDADLISRSRLDISQIEKRLEQLYQSPAMFVYDSNVLVPGTNSAEVQVFCEEFAHWTTQPPLVFRAKLIEVLLECSASSQSTLLKLFKNKITDQVSVEGFKTYAEKINTNCHTLDSTLLERFQKFPFHHWEEVEMAAKKLDAIVDPKERSAALASFESGSIEQVRNALMPTILRTGSAEVLDKLPTTPASKLRKIFARRVHKAKDLELLKAFATTAGEDPVQLAVLDRLEKFDYKDWPDLQLVAEELSRMDSPREQLKVLEAFDSGQLSTVQEELYRAKLRMERAISPDESLAVVREKFENLAKAGHETVPKELFDRVFVALEEILDRSSEYTVLAPNELQRKAKRVKFRKPKTPEQEYEHLIESLSIARVIYNEQFGFAPYNIQMATVLLMLLPIDPGQNAEIEIGRYAQMNTGEGKSLVISFLALGQALKGSKVDVATSNSYLARRDSNVFKGLYGYFGLSVGSFECGGAEPPKNAGPDIMYTTISDLGHGYISTRLVCSKFFNDKGFQTLIVDEADNLCIDSSETLLQIAAPLGETFSTYALKKMRSFARHNEALIKSDLRAAVKKFIKDSSLLNKYDENILAVYLDSAVLAEKKKIGINYVVNNKQIVIIDKDNTGRLKQNTHWKHGLHEFVCLKEGLPLPEQNQPLIAISPVRLIKMYRKLLCLSGTMGSEIDRKIVRSTYKISGLDIPTRRDSKRVDSSPLVLKTKTEHLARLSNLAEDLVKQGRSGLFFAGSIAESEEFYSLLKAAGYKVQLLNDVNNLNLKGVKPKTESELVNAAGQAGVITIATYVAGRGTDIKPTEEVIKAGGLHTELFCWPAKLRSERQARGRSGRQGNSGSSGVSICIETDIVFKSLSHTDQQNILRVLEKYGPDSNEISSALEYVRGLSTICKMQHMELCVSKEALIESLQKTYLRAKEDLGRNGVHGMVFEGLNKRWAQALQKAEASIDVEERLFDAPPFRDQPKDQFWYQAFEYLTQQCFPAEDKNSADLLKIFENTTANYLDQFHHTMAFIGNLEAGKVADYIRNIAREYATVSLSCEGYDIKKLRKNPADLNLGFQIDLPEKELLTVILNTFKDNLKYPTLDQVLSELEKQQAELSIAVDRKGSMISITTAGVQKSFSFGQLEKILGDLHGFLCTN